MLQAQVLSVFVDPCTSGEVGDTFIQSNNFVVSLYFRISLCFPNAVRAINFIHVFAHLCEPLG